MKGVMIISPWFTPNTGGVETHLNDLTSYLTKRDYKVFVSTYQPITTKTKGKGSEISETLEIKRMRWFGSNLFPRLEPYPLLNWIYLFPGLFFLSFYFLIKRRNEIDVIHAHGLVASLITRILNIIFKKKTVMSIHAIYHLDERPLFSKIVRYILRPFDNIFALAERSRKDLISSGLPEKRIKIYTHWVDQGTFKPRNKIECRKELNLDQEFIVLFIGRLLEKKGLKVLIEAAKMIGPKAGFVIVGDGPMKEELERLSSKNKKIIFMGRVPFEDVPKYYNSADVFIIPSQYEEGFARVTLEALSSGVPVIAANKGCLPEVVNDSVGILIDPTAKNIAEKINYFQKNQKALDKLRKEARPYAERCFSKKNAELIVDSYR